MNWPLLGYGAFALLALRPVAGHVAWWLARSPHWNGGNKSSAPDVTDWAFAAFFAAVLCVAWVPVLLLVCGAKLSNRAMPKIGLERVADMERREARVREMERELGLDR